MELIEGKRYILRNSMVVKLKEDRLIYKNKMVVSYIDEYDGCNHREFESLDIVDKHEDN